MVMYLQNGADDGTVIAYPENVGMEIEDFLYDVCGHGSAYPCNPMGEISEVELEEQGFDLDDITVVPDSVIAKCRELMGDEDMDTGEIGEQINDLVNDYVVGPQ